MEKKTSIAPYMFEGHVLRPRKTHPSVVGPMFTIKIKYYLTFGPLSLLLCSRQSKSRCDGKTSYSGPPTVPAERTNVHRRSKGLRRQEVDTSTPVCERVCVMLGLRRETFGQAQKKTTVSFGPCVQERSLVGAPGRTVSDLEGRPDTSKSNLDPKTGVGCPSLLEKMRHVGQ